MISESAVSNGWGYQRLVLSKKKLQEYRKNAIVEK